jgi:hypothetical protein
MNEDILNHGLNLAMEWGKDWLQPIQSRLAKGYPKLTAKELDDYNKVCQEAMKAGHQLVDSLLSEQWKQNSWKTLEDVDSRILKPLFRKSMNTQYPWVSEENLGRLFSQGMYYALK